MLDDRRLRIHMARSLFRKDLLLLFGNGRFVVSSIGLATLFVVISSFAFRDIGYGEAELQALTPGIIWLIFLFTGVVSLNHSFLPEREEGALQGILLSPVNSGVVFLSKLGNCVLFLLTLELLITILHSLFFWPTFFEYLPSFMLVALIFSLGFASLGTLLSSISVVVKEREILLPLILFPLCIPLLIGCVELTRIIVSGAALPYFGFWFTLVVVFDLISLTLSWALFEPLIHS